MNDFSAKTLRLLASRGFFLVSLQGDAYIFNHNGTCRVLTFAQVLEAAR